MKNQKKGSWKDYYPFTSLLIAFFKRKVTLVGSNRQLSLGGGFRIIGLGFLIGLRGCLGINIRLLSYDGSNLYNSGKIADYQPLAPITPSI